MLMENEQISKFSLFHSDWSSLEDISFGILLYFRRHFYLDFVPILLYIVSSK
jgi:hypothetical protein